MLSSPPSPVQCLAPSEELAVTASGIPGVLGELSSSCHQTSTNLRGNPENAEEHIASEDLECAINPLSRSQSVASGQFGENRRRLDYWRAATAKGLSVRNACPSGCRPSKAKSGIPTVARTSSLRHRLSCDQETLRACCDLPQARATQREEGCTGLSGRKNCVSFHSCDSIVVPSSAGRMDSPDPPKHSSPEESQKLQSRLISYPSLGTCSESGDSRASTPRACPSSIISSGKAPALAFPSPSAPLAYLSRGGHGYPASSSPLAVSGLRCQSERVPPERVSRLVSQNSMEYEKSPLERYHSLQDGDIAKVVTKQRTLSYGGPAAFTPSPTPVQPNVNVFEWAAQARMDSKANLSRRQSV